MAQPEKVCDGLDLFQCFVISFLSRSYGGSFTILLLIFWLFCWIVIAFSSFLFGGFALLYVMVWTASARYQLLYFASLNPLSLFFFFLFFFLSKLIR